MRRVHQAVAEKTLSRKDLSWLQPFITLRETRTKVRLPHPSTHYSEGDDVSSRDESVPFLTRPIGDEIQPTKLGSKTALEIKAEFHTNNENGNGELLSPKSNISESGKKNTHFENKSSETTGREKCHQKKDTDIDEAQLSFF